MIFVIDKQNEQGFAKKKKRLHNEVFYLYTFIINERIIMAPTHTVVILDR